MMRERFDRDDHIHPTAQYSLRPVPLNRSASEAIALLGCIRPTVNGPELIAVIDWLEGHAARQW
jgi:hypothetical protein